MLSGDQIAFVGSKQDIDTSEALSLPGCTALPGLIDAHVHMVLDPDDKAPPAPDFLPPLDGMKSRASRMVQAGITTARDLGGGAWRELALRDAIARGETTGPRLLCAGQPVTCPGGHCHFWGGEAADIAAARIVIDRQVAKGVDLIKVMATGGRFTKGSRPLAPQFEQDTLNAIVAAATRHSMPVAAHCHGTPGIEAAARAGVHSIEHCSWVGEAGWAADYQESVAELILKRNIWISPTINRGWQRMLSGSPTLPRMRHAIGHMRTLGIDFMASTDAGIPGVYHHHLPEALAVFAAIAEFTLEQTLTSATADAARGLGLAGVTGRLAAGLSADVLVVDGDPLQDLGCLTRPVAVWASGRNVRSP